MILFRKIDGRNKFINSHPVGGDFFSRQVSENFGYGFGPRRPVICWSKNSSKERENRSGSSKMWRNTKKRVVPSWKLTYPPKKGTFEDVFFFLFPRWDMLVPLRVSVESPYIYIYMCVFFL